MVYVLLACRCALGLVFAVSAGSKLSSRAAFAEFSAMLKASGLVPARWRKAVAVAVIALEIAVVVQLAGVQVPAGLALAVLLLAVFTAGIGLAVRRGTAVACRCFGGSGTTLGYPHLVRNLLLLTLAAVGLAAASGTGAPHPGGVAVAVVAGAAAAAVLVRFDELTGLFTDPV
ncbi:MauE/DoxX family redox-associated membrane protein [Catellatospora sp. NPDC049609]|uniref:MauE/DoxX family redox-associated membrane protein n=1 Tax=Catellatospora sp. NPDC049609 TaxID=3155505 RepID=UPI00342865E7